LQFGVAIGSTGERFTRKKFQGGFVAMKKMMVVTALLALTIAPLFGGGQTETVELNIGTASVGGAYYAMGGGMANLVTQYAEGITMVPVVTGGAVENPRLIQNGDVDIAISNSNIVYFAYNGQPPFESKLDLLAVAALYSSVFHIVVLENSPIKSIPDLKGKKVAVGPAGGGTADTMVPIFEAYGMTPDDITASYISYTDSVTQLADGNLDAVFLQAGYPASAIMQLRATHKIRLIDIEEQKLQAIVKKYPYYADLVLPKNVYNVPKDTLILGIPNTLIVRKDMDEQQVYKITKAIFDHLDEFGEAVATAKQVDIKKAPKTVIPMHPGAQKYFNEIK
jgi:TRAP transporter TAXI family solute receptor